MKKFVFIGMFFFYFALEPCCVKAPTNILTSTIPKNKNK